MKYYLDITLLPDSEADLGFLWKKVYQQIHIALAENKTINGGSAIAVSFPEYGSKVFPLGAKLRLLAKTQEQLNKFNALQWLNRLSDYTHCTSIKEVPLSVDKFVCFKRKQCDTNIERFARRRAKRKGETLEQALQYYVGFKDEESKLPFINMESLSENKKFRLFIQQEIVTEAVAGEFSCYGLSVSNAEKRPTVPRF